MVGKVTYVKYEHEATIVRIELLLKKSFWTLLPRVLLVVLNLLSLNFKKDNNGKINFTNSFLGIAFQATTDPKHITEDATEIATRKNCHIVSIDKVKYLANGNSVHDFFFL